MTMAVASITLSLSVSTLSKVSVRVARGVRVRIGSSEYTPFTLVAFSSTSALISMARSAAAVSVVKNGLPVPAAKITTRPFSRWRTARRRM